MKVRFIQTLSTARELFRDGKDYDLPNEDALRYIFSGVARKAAEPGDPEADPEAAERPLLKPDEKVGDKADTGRPHATPVSRRRTEPKDNPAGFLHAGGPGASGIPEPHAGFNTSNPTLQTSPPSDAPQHLATNEPAPTGPVATKTVTQTPTPAVVDVVKSK